MSQTMSLPNFMPQGAYNTPKKRGSVLKVIIAVILTVFIISAAEAGYYIYDTRYSYDSEVRYLTNYLNMSFIMEYVTVYGVEDDEKEMLKATLKNTYKNMKPVPARFKKIEKPMEEIYNININHIEDPHELRSQMEEIYEKYDDVIEELLSVVSENKRLSKEFGFTE